MKREFYRSGKEISKEAFKYSWCGLDDIYLLNGFTRKQTEHGSGVTISDIKGLHKAIGFSLVTDRKALTPKELRFLRKAMDLTQAELGLQLGVSDQQVARWEKGECETPGPAEKLIRVIYVAYQLPARKRAAFLTDLMKTFRELTKSDETQRPKLVFEETDKGWAKAA